MKASTILVRRLSRNLNQHAFGVLMRLKSLSLEVAVTLEFSGEGFTVSTRGATVSIWELDVCRHWQSAVPVELCSEQNSRE